MGHSACTEDVATKQAYQQQAALDWAQILSARAVELRPGGRLIIANFAVDETGQFLGSTSRVKESMHQQFAEIWKNLVTPEEFLATNFPNQYRTLDEVTAPLASNNNYHDLHLISTETSLVQCPFYDAWLRGEYSAEAHAARYVPTTRSWSNSTFLAGLLRGGTRGAEDREQLVNTLFGEYEARVAADPNAHAMDYVHSYSVFEKGGH